MTIEYDSECHLRHLLSGDLGFMELCNVIYTSTDLCNVWMWAFVKGGDCGQIFFGVDNAELSFDDVCPCVGIAVC